MLAVTRNHCTLHNGGDGGDGGDGAAVAIINTSRAAGGWTTLTTLQQVLVRPHWAVTQPVTRTPHSCFSVAQLVLCAPVPSLQSPHCNIWLRLSAMGI